MIGNIIVLLFVALIACRGSCVDDSIAYRSMDKQGYTDVKVTNHSFFMVGLRGCSYHDAAKFNVKAKNPAGKVVNVYVCTGFIFKGATIRTD